MLVAIIEITLYVVSMYSLTSFNCVSYVPPPFIISFCIYLFPSVSFFFSSFGLLVLSFKKTSLKCVGV